MSVGQRHALAGLPLLACLMTFPSAGLALAKTSPPSALTRLGYSFAPETALGPRKAGLMCLPNGKVRWGDLGPVGPNELQDMLARQLRNLGIIIVSADIAPTSGGDRVSAQIDSLHINGCARKWGLGKQRALSGTGTIGVSWTISSGEVSSVNRFHTESAFAFDQTKGDSILAKAFEAVATAGAPQLRH